MTYSTDEIERLLAGGRLERVGIGARRVCFRLPDGRHCLKCYRNEQEITEGNYLFKGPNTPLAKSVKAEIRKFRFSRARNTNCEEHRYWLALKRRLPDEVMGLFPSSVECLLSPSRGWCIVEEMVLNHDGSAPQLFYAEWSKATPAGKATLLAAFDELEASLARHAVRFYDPQNILVQWLEDGSFRLRVTDFEPASRTLVSLDPLSPALVRRKLHRRFERYLKTFWIRPAQTLWPGKPGPNTFLFVIWSAARRFEPQICAEIAARLKVTKEFDVEWPKRHFASNLAAFYGWRSWHVWRNKARKCGTGPFHVVVVEDPSPVWRREVDTSGHELTVDANVYALKKSFRAMTGRSNVVHSSVTPAETEHQLIALATPVNDPIPFHPMVYADDARIKAKRRRIWLGLAADVLVPLAVCAASAIVARLGFAALAAPALAAACGVLGAACAALRKDHRGAHAAMAAVFCGLALSFAGQNLAACAAAVAFGAVAVRYAKTIQPGLRAMRRSRRFVAFACGAALAVCAAVPGPGAAQACQRLCGCALMAAWAVPHALRELRGKRR